MPGCRSLYTRLLILTRFQNNLKKNPSVKLRLIVTSQIEATNIAESVRSSHSYSSLRSGKRMKYTACFPFLIPPDLGPGSWETRQGTYTRNRKRHRRGTWMGVKPDVYLTSVSDIYGLRNLNGHSASTSQPQHPQHPTPVRPRVQNVVNRQLRLLGTRKQKRSKR